ncbi:hypothetical protein BKA81DRAFT_356793 [Phyllosticta paracitricarpa]
MRETKKGPQPCGVGSTLLSGCSSHSLPSSILRCAARRMSCQFGCMCCSFVAVFLVLHGWKDLQVCSCRACVCVGFF